MGFKYPPRGNGCGSCKEKIPGKSTEELNNEKLLKLENSMTEKSSLENTVVKTNPTEVKIEELSIKGNNVLEKILKQVEQ